MSCLLNKSPLRLIPCRLFHCVFSTEYLYTRWKGANLKHPYNLKFSTLSIDTHQALGSPSIHRCSPCPWLSLRESWREAPERAHCTNSTKKLPTDPPHRFFIRNCIPPRTVCTSLSPSLREVPLRSGEARAGWKLQAAAQNGIYGSVYRCPLHP